MALRDHFLALFGVAVALGLFSAGALLHGELAGRARHGRPAQRGLRACAAAEPGVLRDHADRRGAVAPDHRHDAGADGGRLVAEHGPAQRGDGRRRAGHAGLDQPLRDGAGAAACWCWWCCPACGSAGACASCRAPARTAWPTPARSRPRCSTRFRWCRATPPRRARRRASTPRPRTPSTPRCGAPRARSVLVAFIIIATSAALLWGLYQGTQAVLRGDITAGHLGQTVVYVIILAGAAARAGRGLRRPAARRRRHRAADGTAGRRARPSVHRRIRLPAAAPPPAAALSTSKQ